ncbi:YncE family protein [Rubrivirga sp. IMCC43871]|uniref:YncE family protein n=1 Tax=Rubrivirga sp. IMCC43871 TaxID=3391575 RepID=UPI00398F9917
MRILSLLALVVVVGCDSTAPDATGSVYVANQGIFSDNSGSVTRFDPDTGTATADLAPGLGGLVQSVETVGDRVFAFLNFSDSFGTGSGRIAEVDPTTGTVVGEAEVGTPRAWAVVGGTAFVTNFYGASVTPVSLSGLAAGAPIPVGDNPEGIAAVGDRIYVANYSAGFDFGAGRTVSVISASGRAVVETIDVGCDGPRFVFADGDGEVWVVCTGRTIYDADFNVVGQTTGDVVVLDGATGDEVARPGLPGQVGSGTLGTDAAHSAAMKEVYVSLGDRLLVFGTDSNAGSSAIVVDGPPISAVAFDDIDSRFYLGRVDADAPFSAPGTVTVHDRDGRQLAQFGAGVLPSAVAFGPAR